MFGAILESVQSVRVPAGFLLLFLTGAAFSWLTIRRWMGRWSPDFPFTLPGFCAVWCVVFALLGLAMPGLMNPIGPLMIAAAMVLYGPYLATAAVEIGAMFFQPSAERSSPAAASISKALREMHAGRPDAACARFEEALSLDPGLCTSYAAYAEVLRKLGLRGRAFGVLGAGIERADPGFHHVDLVRMCAEWLVEEGRESEARSLVARARRRYEKEDEGGFRLDRSRLIAAIETIEKQIGAQMAPPPPPGPEKLDLD